jgi:hypothetical protein
VSFSTILELSAAAERFLHLRLSLLLVVPEVGRAAELVDLFDQALEARDVKVTPLARRRAA